MRDSTIFYRSFYEAIKELPAQNQADVYSAIFEYSLNFTEIQLTGLSKTIFTLIKPQLDANLRRFRNGSIPKDKQEESKTEAKPKQTISKTEANNNNNVNNNKNLNVNVINIQPEDEDKNELWTNDILLERDFKFSELAHNELSEVPDAEWIKSHLVKCNRDNWQFTTQHKFRKSLIGWIKTCIKNKNQKKNINSQPQFDPIKR